MTKPLVALTVAALIATGMAHAAETTRASKDDAVALVKKAVAHYKAVGREKALGDFSLKTGNFVRGELYVYASDLTGKTVAHGANEKLIGRDMSALKDAEGKAFVAEIMERTKAGKSGWTDYKWPNPVTKDIEAKTTYCEPIDALAICAGVYK